VVFTLPAAIADIAYHNKAAIYDSLFKAAAETLTTIAADPKHLGARSNVRVRFDFPARNGLTKFGVADFPGIERFAADAEKVGELVIG